MKRFSALSMVLIAAAALSVCGPGAQAQPKPRPMSADGSGIFVPAPRGAGDTLDESATPAGTAVGDIVTTQQGDRLLGKVIAIEAGGKLRLMGPQFQGEVVVSTSALDRVALQCAHQSAGDDEVVMSNGDRILGQVKAITAEAVVIESSAAGTLSIPRKVMQRVTFAQGQGSLLESRFETGQMEPWKKLSGVWTLGEGGLSCTTSGNRFGIAAQLEQKEAVTLEAKVKAVGGQQLYCDIVLFADTADGQYGRNSVFARFYSSEYYLGVVREGNQNNVMNRSIGRSIQEGGVLRFAYDPAAQKAHLWLDSMDLGEYGVPNGPTSGKLVMFYTQYVCQISQIRVLRGVVPPSADAAALEDTESIEFANKDHVSASQVSLADGVLVLQTTFGELKGPVQNARSIMFRKQGREEPRRNKGDVRVDTPDGRLTFQLEQLNEQQLTGNSAYIGPVKILRTAVKGIQFNVYKGV